jgi:hypothetical protein
VVENVAKHHDSDFKGWTKLVDGLVKVDDAKALLLECIVEAHALSYVREGVSKGFRETLAGMGIDLAKTTDAAKAMLKKAEEEAEAAKEAAKASAKEKTQKKLSKKAKGPLARKQKAAKAKV